MATATLTAPWVGKHFIDGAFVPPATGQTREVIEKATGAVLTEAAEGSAADIDRAVAVATQAQPRWASLRHTERSRILRAVADELEHDAERFHDWIQRETGCIRGKAQYEVSFTVESFREAAALAGRTGAEWLPSTIPGKTNFVDRVPIGAIGVITPWNFPLVLSMYVVAPALALGNVVVLKPSEETPVTGGLLMAEVFERVGAPAGVFQVVTGTGTGAGQPLAEHPGIQKISFTGSATVGRRIAETAGRQLKRVALELGGNNALIVLEDADLEQAATIGAWSAWHYQGQTCITASRHIVVRSLAGAYVEALAERARKLAVGDPFTEPVGLGPMINVRQRDRAHSFLTASVKAGATLVEGGRYDGLFYRPTVVSGVTPEMPLYREEVFGPIAPITVVDDEEEALRLANSVPEGLVAAVVTGDRWRGFRFAQQVRAGMVHVNDTTCLAEVNCPFGGVGASGNTRTGGDANLESFTDRRWISVQETPVAYPY